ncbi:MAG: (2Fe-2S)-binding protein [Acidobacteriota bacterium]|nr:(2Fe-2S)-binding protein [Acidobacteriota bacterium]
MARLRVNGRSHDVQTAADAPLLYALRNDLGLSGPKFGCGLGQCGACTVLVDGRATRSCIRRVGTVAEDAEIVTVEGLGAPASPHPLQSAFIAEQAVQCGYCTAGLVMAGAALLQETPDPGDDQIRAALDGHLCRCGAYGRVVRAVRRAAGEMRR